jgi:hypothetical protein
VGSVRTGRSGRAGDGQAFPTFPPGKVVTGRVAAGGAAGSARTGRGLGRSCDTSSGGAPSAPVRARTGTPSMTAGITGRRGGVGWDVGGWGSERDAGSAGVTRPPPPGPSASTLGRIVEPGVATCPLDRRGGRLAGCPWSRTGTGTGAAFSTTAGTLAFVRPRLATAPLAAPAAPDDPVVDAVAAAAIAAVAIAAAARSDAWRPRQTRADRTIWSFSASGVSLTHVRGSVR